MTDLPPDPFAEHERATQDIVINLNPNGVAAPAMQAAAFAANVVGTLVRSLETNDLEHPDMRGGFMGYRFAMPQGTVEDRRHAYQNWLLVNGLRDLTRGVRASLEEAHAYLYWMNRKEHQTTEQQIHADIAASRKAAQRPNIHDLIKAVNVGLTEPLTFERELVSIQKARNCLEHRRGIVSNHEIDPATGVLTLSFPRLKTYFVRGEEEVELAPGVVVDTHADGSQFPRGENVLVLVKRVTRTLTFALGDHLAISSSDFYEIAMACHFFAADLGSKLPTLAVGETPLVNRV